MSPSSPTPVPATTARPTVADALTYFRRNPESLDDIEYGGSDAGQRQHAATLVRAALAAELDAARILTYIANDLLDGSDGDSEYVQAYREIGERLHEEAAKVRASSPPAGDTTTETRTEYRITSRTPNGLGRRLSCGSSLGKARERAAVLRAEGSTEVTVESRTVSTTRTESPWEEEQ